MIRPMSPEPLFNAFVRADVMDLEAHIPQTGHQGDIRGHVSGGAAAGENDAFHTSNRASVNSY